MGISSCLSLPQIGLNNSKIYSNGSIMIGMKIAIIFMAIAVISALANAEDDWCKEDDQCKCVSDPDRIKFEYHNSKHDFSGFGHSCCYRYWWRGQYCCDNREWICGLISGL